MALKMALKKGYQERAKSEKDEANGTTMALKKEYQERVILEKCQNLG